MHADPFSGISTSWGRLKQNGFPSLSPHTIIWTNPRYCPKAPISHDFVKLFLIMHCKFKAQYTFNAMTDTATTGSKHTDQEVQTAQRSPGSRLRQKLKPGSDPYLEKQK